MMQLLMQLAEFTLKATLVIGLGAMCAWLSRWCSAAWTNRIWRLTLCGVMAVPFFMLAGDFGGRNTAIPVFQASQQVYLRPAMEYPVEHPVIRNSSATPVSVEFDPTNRVMSVYIVGAAVSLISLSGGLIKARRAVKGAQPMPPVSLGFRPPAMLVSNKISVPSTCGFLSPVILLPAGAVDWPDDRLNAAVRHEWAHIQRRDWMWQMAVRFVAAFQWFNPAIWFLQHAMKSSAEQAADEHVLASGFGAARYARELLEVAAAAQPSGMVVAMAGRGDLKSRLRRILSTTPYASPGAWIRYPLIGLFGLFTLIVGVVGAHGFRHGSIASFAPGKPFYGPATLRDGSVVRVEYLQDWTVSPNRLWMPDGSPASEMVRRGSLHIPAPSTPPSGPSPIRLRISTTGKRDPVNWCLRVPFETAAATYGTYGTGDGSNARDMATIYAPDSIEQTDLRVGIGTGPWRVCPGAIYPEFGPMSTKGWWNMTCKRFGPRTDGKPDDMPLHQADTTNSSAYVAAGPSDGQVCVSITIPKQYHDMQVMLKAYNAKGHELPCAGSQMDAAGTGSYPDGKRQFIFVGDGEKPTRFELVGRPYEWVTFRGIRIRR